MDGATIQSRIYAGRGRAALRVGLDCRQYRPLTVSAPLGNLVGTIKAAFNAGDDNYRSANEFGDAVWHADLDGRLTRPGDYLVRVTDGQIWYVAGQQQLLPILMVDCNRSVRVLRQQQTPGAVGLLAYGSASPCDPATMAALLGTTTALWPASILLNGRGMTPSAGLPGSARMAGWRILLPPSIPVTIRAGDLAIDDLGRRYTIDAAENTDLGWRCNAQELHA